MDDDTEEDASGRARYRAIMEEQLMKEMEEDAGMDGEGDLIEADAGQREHYEEILAEKRRLEDAMIERFNGSVAEATGRTWTFPPECIRSLKGFLESLTAEEMSGAMQIAMGKLSGRNAGDVFRYFCGICHRKIKAMGAGPCCEEVED